MTKSEKINPRLRQTAQVQRCDWPACGAACCVYGTWVDKVLMDNVLEHAKLIIPFLPADHQDPDTWFDGQAEDDQAALSGRVHHTTVIPSPEHYGGTACIFLRADQKCALQAAAEANQLHRWNFKPFYCILHPLELDLQGNLTIDDLEIMLQEPASCLRKAEEPILLTDLFKEEIDYLLNLNRDQKDNRA
ncbi:MAG: hypothetical protein ABFS17_05895 [Chloroflexota bacterium]